MNKTIAIVFIALFLASTMVMAQTFGQIRFLEIGVQAGGEVEGHANLINKGESTLKDVKLTLYIPELGLYYSFGHTNIKDDPVGKMMIFDLEDNVEPGWYWVQVRAYSTNHWESQWREIFIY